MSIEQEKRDLAEKCREFVKAAKRAMRHEKCPIFNHRLLEVVHECQWCEREYCGEKGGKAK